MDTGVVTVAMTMTNQPEAGWVGWATVAWVTGGGLLSSPPPWLVATHTAKINSRK